MLLGDESTIRFTDSDCDKKKFLLYFSIFFFFFQHGYGRQAGIRFCRLLNGVFVHTQLVVLRMDG